ncbi:MAG: glycosyltransferase [Proteobacteria bacterium]|nr:glycosyltransferase [Pseudomonadota bacterium]
MNLSVEKPRVLFIQATEPGAYPPLINAAHLMAEAGWEVTFLAAPFAGMRLQVNPSPAITVIDMPERPSHVLTKADYWNYCRQAVILARRLKPRVVYASDPIGALPGLLAAKFSGGRLVYHEHDSPTAESELHSVVRWARRFAATAASLVVLPNAERGRLAQQSIGFNPDKLKIVWNVPRRAVIPDMPNKPDSPLILYFHGSITPDRLPETVVEAVSRFNGAIRLDVAGYEAPGAKRYIQNLVDRFNRNGLELIRYLGPITYQDDLLKQAAQSHVGLALMPMESADVNMRYMVGASNKPFDYMAAGLPLLVSDIPEWRATYVDQGFGLACNPNSVPSIEDALKAYLEDLRMREHMAKQCRDAIKNKWCYENYFGSVIKTFAL